VIITIDGPVATGKSTIAKKLAQSIGYIYFDTGAMYRSLTYGLLKEGVDYEDPEALAGYLDKFDFDIKVKQGERRYFVDGEDISDAIRQEKVTSKVSQISAISQVREKLVLIQRKYAEGVNAVVEGRDMGTVVFPDADLKIFLTGRPKVRAQRRFDELKSKYPDDCHDLTLEKTLEEISERDRIDSTREVSPLKQADDAFEIDTSDLSIPEVVMKIQECKDSRKTR